ncbi:VOC family protein [Microbacterium sp.]|jgi:catechol 2,3-dioxygenase-like lactoylglutathione lyase family enzyme|uniref:VOC family protein n=1 Tax=Microbacterium sp. TaxID=51671 RepID=UPI0037C8A9C8
MPFVDHLGMTVDDLPAAIVQWDPVLTALGYTRTDAHASVAWDRDGATELILFPAREPGTGPHRHGTVGWQHLAFDIATRAEVDRLHAIAVAAGWSVVREPKLYPRFNERYYASFVEDDNGIRIEFAHNPPRTTPPRGTVAGTGV